MLVQKSDSMVRSCLPEITIYFWIIKVLCTTVGETASDYLNVNLNFGLTGTSVVMGILLAIVLYFQFRSKKYTPILYWLTVVLVSIFGTLVTDNLTDVMGVPLELSTIVFTVLLALTFLIWYGAEKTLAVHTIFTRRREIFYWLTILFTFALGTASGDLMAEKLALGYSLTGIIVCVVILVFALAWKLGLDSVLAFWLIYIMTRPLGASLGDYLSQPAKYGGLGLGATITSVIFLAAILLTVVFLSVTKKDVIARETIVEEEKELEKPNVVWQVVVTLAVILVVSGVGYFWRSNVLQGGMADTATSEVQNGTIGVTEADLADLRTIAQDTLDLAQQNNFAGAKTRIADLEREWDSSVSQLKPKDPAKWNEIDGAIDQALSEVRASHPDAARCQSSLEVLLEVLK